jgi:DNA-directed RNA polymerase specialized sigma24 family protein
MWGGTPAGARGAGTDLGPFTAFVSARMGALLSYAHMLTGDLGAAEDVVADVPEPATASTPADLTAQFVVERDAMWRALATLPPRQRAVIVLRYYEELTEAEIAAALQCSPGTVKSQAAKAMTHLRAQMADSRVTP